MAARRPSARVAARRAGGGEVERRAAGWTPATGTTEATMPMIRKKINYTGLAPLLSHDATVCDSGRRLPCDATAQFFRPLDDAHSMRNATVFVVEAHDVVFAQVIPALHFDHYQRLVARIFQPVACLDRDEGRLVDQKRINAIAVGDARFPADDHPVFTAPVVKLQRQGGARPDLDTLDLEAGPFLQHRIRAPWAGDGAVRPVGVVAASLELADDFAHAL